LKLMVVAKESTAGRANHIVQNASVRQVAVGSVCIRVAVVKGLACTIAHTR
jgi:hypothetical protein